MIKATRSTAPTCLSAVTDGTTELDRARAHFTNGGAASDFDFVVYSRAAVRTELQRMFHGKCAYCEHFYAGSFTEDVEHFRPKGRIDTDTGSLSPGYWWLGSSWANLLPSCARCNKVKRLELYDGSRLKVGKGNRFPLADETLRATIEGGEVHEIPLLIDPTAEDPADFLTFELREGWCVVRPKCEDENSLIYRKARASIDIYGLNRRELVKDRTRIYVSLNAAVENMKLLATLLSGLDDEAKAAISKRMRDERNRIVTLITADQPHAGMSRWSAGPMLSDATLTEVDA